MRILIMLLVAVLQLAAREYNVREFGAKGDFVSNDRNAIQAAIDACHKEGGGTVVVPAGRYLSGALILRSHITLRLDAGATIYASKKPEDYQVIAENVPRKTLLSATDAEDIAIVGKGVLNGQAPEDFGKRWGAPEDNRFRTGVILFTNCKNLTFRDFTILYSDSWTMHLRRCDGVDIDAITILNNVRRLNSDGIDPDSCRNVHISNCHLVAGDDTIDLKSSDGHPTENVVVTNCTLETTTTGLKIGTATDGDFRDVHYSNITIKAPSGIGFYVKDGATVERFTFSNISIETPAITYREVVPIYMDIERRNANSRLGHIRDIAMRDIFVRSGAGILIQGMPESLIDNLSIRNLTFRVSAPDDFAQRSKPVGGPRTTHDERDTKYIRMPAYMTMAYTTGLLLEDVRIVQDDAALSKYERSPLSVNESSDVVIRGMHSTAPKGSIGLPVIALHNVSDVVVSNSEALPGTGTFVRMSGPASKRVSLLSNQLDAASQAKVEMP